jgi:hypothetical protein
MVLSGELKLILCRQVHMILWKCRGLAKCEYAAWNNQHKTTLFMCLLVSNCGHRKKVSGCGQQIRICQLASCNAQ